jgi:hypothetical protein
LVSLAIVRRSGLALTANTATETAILSGRVAIVFGGFAAVCGTAQVHGLEEVIYL